MSELARRFATYEDILAAPEHMVAEIIDGELHLQPRPAGPHTVAATVLVEEIGPPFRRGKGGPGGWIILAEPELHLGPDILVPDIAGWRRTTMDHVANVAYFEVRPDWICEILSPSTEKIDRTRKLGLYAAAGISHAWMVNPLLHTFEVLRLERGHWVNIGSFSDEQHVRAEPFDAIEIELGELWADVRL
jgi:Uma2 family endonuclease